MKAILNLINYFVFPAFNSLVISKLALTLVNCKNVSNVSGFFVFPFKVKLTKLTVCLSGKIEAILQFEIAVSTQMGPKLCKVAFEF